MLRTVWCVNWIENRDRCATSTVPIGPAPPLQRAVRATQLALLLDYGRRDFFTPLSALLTPLLFNTGAGGVTWCEVSRKELLVLTLVCIFIVPKWRPVRSVHGFPFKLLLVGYGLTWIGGTSAKQDVDATVGQDVGVLVGDGEGGVVV